MGNGSGALLIECPSYIQHSRESYCIEQFLTYIICGLLNDNCAENEIMCIATSQFLPCNVELSSPFHARQCEGHVSHFIKFDQNKSIHVQSHTVLCPINLCVTLIYGHCNSWLTRAYVSQDSHDIEYIQVVHIQYMLNIFVSLTLCH